MWNNIFLNGLFYVHQLFGDDMKWKTDQQVWEEFGLSYLSFNSLKSAIPQKWKTFFMETNKGTYLPLAPTKYDQCINVYKQNFSRRVYKALQDDVMIIHGKYLRWIQ